MSSPKYCANPEPHAGHEWSHAYTFGSGFTTVDHFYCWGILDVGAVRRAIEIRNQARERLVDAEHNLSVAAVVARRTEDEFYGLVPERTVHSTWSDGATMADTVEGTSRPELQVDP